VATKASATNASALGVPAELVVRLGTPATLQLHVSKRKAFQPPPPAHLFGDGPEHHGRTSCPEQPATWCDRGWTGMCYGSSRGCRPAAAKWAAQVPNQVSIPTVKF
jgi:hypothetical protein